MYRHKRKITTHGLLETWLSTRNETQTLSARDVLPTDIMEVRYPLPILDRVLAAFVFEARRADGNFYPGVTLKNILAALLCVMKYNQGACNVISCVDKVEREKNYPCLPNALDRILRLLWENGIGVERKRAAIIMPDMESRVWETGVIGCHTPQALLQPVFFYNGKNVCLRGVNEQQSLRFAQIH